MIQFCKSLPFFSFFLPLFCSLERCKHMWLMWYSVICVIDVIGVITFCKVPPFFCYENLILEKYLHYNHMINIIEFQFIWLNSTFWCYQCDFRDWYDLVDWCDWGDSVLYRAPPFCFFRIFFQKKNKTHKIASMCVIGVIDVIWVIQFNKDPPFPLFQKKN